MRKLVLVASHVVVAGLGFALGAYTLPLLIAPAAPSGAEVAQQAASASYTGRFRRDLKDSDTLHWGEGTVSIGAKSIAFDG